MAGETLVDAACGVLLTSDPWVKAERSKEAARQWAEGRIQDLGHGTPPDRPGRPVKPELLPPNAMPKRQAGGAQQNRFALLHAVAHIELNAIDLAWDIVARFAPALPRDFADDWVSVADEESRHFLMLSDRLKELGGRYGDLPAHDGLWESAQETSGDILARLAIVPLVLEARGLDVTPAMIEKLERAGDDDSAGVLRIIYRDEVGHVATGIKWFEALCRIKNVDSRLTWKTLVNQHFRGQLKPPFNVEARDRAGFSAEFYLGESRN